MSSPIARTEKSNLETLLIKSHQKLSHNKRIDYLSTIFIRLISELNLTGQLLDIGCGDMSIAENISQQVEGIAFTCLDTYELPADLSDAEKWKKYVAFDGRNMPFEDRRFKAALLCDVLHHDFEHASRILSEAARVAEYVIIKDHFEYGMWSRQTLRLMDFIGNWGYGVSVPDRYFTQKSYQEIISKQTNLEEIQQLCPVPLYEHSKVFNLICPGKLQFISVLRNR